MPSLQGTINQSLPRSDHRVASAGRADGSDGAGSAGGTQALACGGGTRACGETWGVERRNETDIFSGRTSRGASERVHLREGTGRGHMDIGETARHAGVSPGTVSYVLSGKRPVAPATRKQVQDVIDELGYRPNATARALKEGRTRTLGLVNRSPEVVSAGYGPARRASEGVHRRDPGAATRRRRGRVRRRRPLRTGVRRAAPEGASRHDRRHDREGGRSSGCSARSRRCRAERSLRLLRHRRRWPARGPSGSAPANRPAHGLLQLSDASSGVPVPRNPNVVDAEGGSTPL